MDKTYYGCDICFDYSNWSRKYFSCEGCIGDSAAYEHFCSDCVKYSNWKDEKQYLKEVENMRQQQVELQQGVRASCKQRATDVQVGGNHYKQFPIQPIEFIEKNKLSFLQGDIIKRICRYNKEGGKGKQDLEKIIHECQLVMQFEYQEEK